MSMFGFVLEPVKKYLTPLVGGPLVRLLPDYTPHFDVIINLLSQYSGSQLIRIYNLLIHVAIRLLFLTHAQVQLTDSQYETKQLLDVYDYIVVGGGTTGAMMANRLVSNSKATVLLIESGGSNNYVNLFPYINSLNVNDSNYDMNWHLRSTYQPYGYEYTDSNLNRTSYEGGGKGLGGTSQINWQIYSRGFDIDYDRYESVYKAAGWNSGTLIDAMKRSSYQNGYDGFEPESSRHSLSATEGEEQVSVSIADQRGMEGIIGSFIEKGSEACGTKVLYDHNSNQLGFARMQFAVQENGYTGHAGRRFIYPIRKNSYDERNKRLHILLHSDVQEILFDKNDNNLRTTGVLVTTPKGLREFKTTNDVIVTAGFYGTPALLLRSGIGPKTELEAMKVRENMVLDGVGKNLHNHQAALPLSVTFPYGKNFSDVSVKQLVMAFYNGSGRFRSENGVSAVGFDIIKSDDVENLVEGRPNIEYILYYPSAGSDNARRTFINSIGVHEDIFEEVYAKAYGGSLRRPKESLFASATHLHSKARGQVTARNNKTEITYHYLSDENDLPILSLGFATLSRVLYNAFSPLGGVLPNEPVRGCEDEFKSWTNGVDPNDIYANYSRCIKSASQDIASCRRESITERERDYWKCFVKKMTMSTWHMGGTARFGDCGIDPQAVVDNQCRVCNIPNLRISDASTIPEQISGHNIATLYGITQLCSEKILADNK